MPIAELRKITKIYPGGILANDEVDFCLEKGEIRALLGENGAGKTTLMKIMSGCLTPTKGSIHLEEEQVEFKSPADALRHGIGMVHQHFTLIPTMTVLDNLKLGFAGHRLEKERLLKDAEEQSRMLGFKVTLDSPIYALSVGERQRIEILRLLLRRAKILVFDEPTSLLCGPEIDRFLDSLKLLSSEGYSVILITHKIREAMQVSDKVTVMRKGKVVATLRRDEIKDEAQLIELIMGERLAAEMVKRAGPTQEAPLLLVKNLVVKDDQGMTKVNGVSFEVYSGEVLGVAGVEGNGQKELIETIAGLRELVSGEIAFPQGGAGSTKLNYIPAERVELGVALELNVAKNTVLRSFESQDFKQRGGILNLAKIEEFAKRVVSFMDVKTPSVRTPVKYLSGGNVQKLIVGREMIRPSEVLVAEQPTAGLDARSTYLVRNTLSELASKGVGILLVSSDLDEVLELSDRVAVIKDGKMVRVFSREEADPKLIGSCMLLSEAS